MFRKIITLTTLAYLIPATSLAEVYRVTVRDIGCGQSRQLQIQLPVNLNVSELRISATAGMVSDFCASNTGNGTATATGLINYSVAPQINLSSGTLQPLSVVTSVPISIEGLQPGESECTEEKTRARTVQPYINWSNFLEAGHTYLGQVQVNCTSSGSIDNGNGMHQLSGQASLQLVFEDRQ